MYRQKGFGLVGLLVAVLTITAVCGAGYYVWNQNKDEATTDTVSTQNTMVYIEKLDSTNAFKYNYSDNWEIQPFMWEDFGGSIGEVEPDWATVIQPITLYPSDDMEVLVTIVSESYGDYYDSYLDLKTKVKEDYFASVLFEGTREDGHEALFAKVDYLGPPDAKVESFTDYRYYFDNGTNYVRI